MSEDIIPNKEINQQINKAASSINNLPATMLWRACEIIESKTVFEAKLLLRCTNSSLKRIQKNKKSSQMKESLF